MLLNPISRRTWFGHDRFLRRDETFEDVRALHDVTFHIERGEVFGLVGAADGAGKTTLLRILPGLLRPDAGRCGLPAAAPGSVPRLCGTAVQPLPDTDGKNMELMGQLYGLSAGKAAERARILLDFVGLTAAADRQAGGFSGGMKQKTGAGRGLDA